MKSTMAERIAQAARDFLRRTADRVCESVTVALSDDTLVITLRGALTPAEQALARTTEGAARVQNFHRQLFASSAASLRAQIARITGVAVREAAAEVDSVGGPSVQVFTTGTMVQVFQLAERIVPAHFAGRSTAKRIKGPTKRRSS